MSRDPGMATLFVAALLTAALAQAAPKGTVQLISAAEYRRELAAEPLPSPRASPQADGPSIELLAPSAGTAALPSPVDIHLRWRAQGEAKIDLKSLRITYGFLALDITQRVLAGAELHPDGLRILKAALPKGEHSLTVEIADTLKRVAQRQFEVKVLAGG